MTMRVKSISKTPRVKLIHLRNIGRRMKDVRRLREDIISSLGDSYVTFSTMNELVFASLKFIYPISNKVQFNEGSLQINCGRIIDHFGYKESKASILSDGEFKEIDKKPKTNIDLYCEHILGIMKAPREVYQSLRFTVEQDLLEITELISWYEQEPCIIRFLKQNEIPRIHEDRIKFDFYKRCEEQKKQILSHYLFGLKQRTVEKTRFRYDLFRAVFGFQEEYHDRPYHFARQFSRQFFDCREIDVCGHRLDVFHINEVGSMRKLFAINRESFYKRYFKCYSLEQHFSDINYHLPYLPTKNDRTLIFKELIRLYKGRRWISFYALAIPQIEGLFSEMCYAIDPDKDYSTKSLSYKVLSVRPFHSYDSYFDYYQYHIPRLRNKFSHTGYEEHFRLGAKDLLVDLAHLVKIFTDLDSPIIEIQKIHTRKKFDDFITMREFVYYFRLIGKLKSKHLVELKETIVKFEAEFLTKYCSLDYTCYNLIQELPNKINELINHINSNYAIFFKKIEIEKLNKTELKEVLAIKEKVEVLSDSFNFHNELLSYLEDALFFINNYNKYLPNLDNQIKIELKKLNNQYSSAIIKILNVNSTVKKTHRSQSKD
jgi:hypothetical protein